MKRIVSVCLFLLACALSGHAQSNLASPTNVIATSTGGTTTYTYAVVASNGTLYSIYTLSNTLTTGATFTYLPYSPTSLTCTGVTGATSYLWYRVTGSTGQFGRFATTSSCAASDTGAPGDGSLPWSLTNVGISAASLQNAIWLDGCNISAVNPNYPCTGAGLQQAINDAHGFAGVTGVVMVPQTAQIPGSTLGAIFGSNTTITMPSSVCVIGAGPNASFYDSNNEAVAFAFPAGTVNSCLVNMAVELDDTDTNGVAIRFEGSSSAQTTNNKVINFTCYNNPAYGYPTGETCIQIDASSPGEVGTGVWNNFFQNITIQNVTQPVAFSGVSCSSHPCNDFADIFDNIMVTGWGASGTALSGQFEGDTINAYLHDSGASSRTGVSLQSGARGNHVKILCDLAAADTACVTDAAGFNFIDVLNANGTPATSGVGITGDVVTDVEWLNLFTSFQTQRLILGDPVRVGNLPASSANPGMIMRVSDSTAISNEGQICVGSSSNVAIAISNGTAWKCF
jgi:hypothetical protein